MKAVKFFKSLTRSLFWTLKGFCDVWSDVEPWKHSFPGTFDHLVVVSGHEPVQGVAEEHKGQDRVDVVRVVDAVVKVPPKNELLKINLNGFLFLRSGVCMKPKVVPFGPFWNIGNPEIFFKHFKPHQPRRAGNFGNPAVSKLVLFVDQNVAILLPWNYWSEN